MVGVMDRRERFYLKIYWTIMVCVVLVLYFFQGTERLFGDNLIVFKVWVISFVISINLAKTLMVYSGKFWSETYFYFYRMLEIVLLVGIVTMFETHPWLYIMLFFPIMATSITRGVFSGVVMGFYASLLNILFLFVLYYHFLDMDYQLVLKTFESMYPYYAITLLLPFIVLFEFNNKSSLDLFRSSNNKKDIQENINKLIESSQMLEDSNTILEDTNAELFTVQCIVKEINSILDFKNLSESVLDIILGVTGAKSVSLFTLIGKSRKLNLVCSSLQDSQSQLILEDYANMSILKDLLKEKQLKYYNNVDINDELIIDERNISSVMIVPISSLAKEEGVILVEHSLRGYFSEDMLRLMDVISQQISLVFEKVYLYDQMHELAIKDGLTGIYNRVYFQDRLKEEIEIAKYNNTELSIVLFDIDNFKTFNDTYGHMFGDSVIKNVVNVVKDELRKDDVFARFGGEEFVIIFANTDSERAFYKTDYIRKMLEKAYIYYANKKIRVTASFGISSYPINGSNSDELIKEADDALYSAKKSGRNCVFKK